MKLTLSIYARDTIKLLLSSIFELLLFLPVWILFKVYVLPKQIEPMLMSALPVLTLAGILLRYRCSIRWKQLLTALILGGVLGVLSSGGLSIDSLPLGVAGFVCTFIGLTATSRDRMFRIYWTGIGIYFVCTIVFHRIPALESSVTLLTWCGSLCLVLTLLISNRNYLRYSSLSQANEALPKGIEQNNRIFVIIIGIVAAVLAAGVGKAIGSLVWGILRSFFSFINRLFTGSSEPPPPPVDTPQGGPQLPPIGDQKPGLLSAILDVALYTISAVLAVVAIYYAIRWLYRNAGGKLRKAMDAVLSMLRREHSPKSNSSYLDEEKSVFTWEQTVQGLKDFWSTRLPSRHRKDRWDQMNSEQERVRWLYRRWLSTKRDHGYELKSYLTPKETESDVLKWAEHNKITRKGDEATSTASDHLVKVYDQVRYGEEDPSASDTAVLKERLKL
jgi:hypothetical protein